MRAALVRPVPGRSRRVGLGTLAADALDCPATDAAPMSGLAKP